MGDKNIAHKQPTKKWDGKQYKHKIMLDNATLKEVKTKTILPYREFSVGIYREKKKLVVLKFELIGAVRIPLDEEYVLNIDDALIVMNIQFHNIHKFRLN